MLDDGQPQPRPPHLAAAVAVHPVETFRQPGDVDRVDPLALIGHLDPHRRAAHGILGRQCHLHHLPSRPIFQCVFNKVGENLHKLVRVARHHRPLTRQRNRRPLTFGHPPQRGDHPLQKWHQIHLAFRAHAFLGLDPGKLQQVAHKAVHPARLMLHDPQKHLARLGVVLCGVFQRLDEPHKGGQRGA